MRCDSWVIFASALKLHSFAHCGAPNMRRRAKLGGGKDGCSVVNYTSYGLKVVHFQDPEVGSTFCTSHGPHYPEAGADSVCGVADMLLESEVMIEPDSQDCASCSAALYGREVMRRVSVEANVGSVLKLSFLDKYDVPRMLVGVCHKQVKFISEPAAVPLKDLERLFLGLTDGVCSCVIVSFVFGGMPCRLLESGASLSAAFSRSIAAAAGVMPGGSALAGGCAGDGDWLRVCGVWVLC
ncbi:hypothetical protein E2C01_033008 [Portunus trituberculatus]|uniref:Uncharacterized protein n=1 Tax=Portunus trituberculatus TaxID=210409 RepID=A0A5B7EZ03_PORTR|nr:hypothetical protein [Portunus trituberculatus]